MLLLLSEFLIYCNNSNHPYSTMCKGGGVPDNEWNEPAPTWPKEPADLRESIFKEVAMNMRKDIGLFQSALRSEMEAYVEKLVGEVCTVFAVGSQSLVPMRCICRFMVVEGHLIASLII